MNSSEMEKNFEKKEKTMVIALILSSFGPFAMGISVFLSNSKTITADFVRRLTELLAMFVSWYLFRYIGRRNPPENIKDKYEQMAKYGVATAMAISSLVMFIMGISSLKSSALPSGNLYPGLSIALLGALTNGFFWRRYERLNAVKHDEITRNQSVLYRAKTAVDIYVLLATLSIILLKPGPVTAAIDFLGSTGVSLYLAYNAYEMFFKKTISPE